MLDGKSNVGHTHNISDTTGLQDALDGKANTSHTQAISTIINLQTTLDGKAALNHADRHVNGSDDIQEATASQKGLATAFQITKLNGIEDGADVTDTENVDAAGAVMNTDTDTTPMQFVLNEDDFASLSPTKIPTQLSTKKYIDSQTLFGDYYVYEEDDAQSSTSSSSYVNKVTLDTPDLPSGRYRINWSFEWRGRTGSDIKIRVQFSGTTISLLNMEAKDSSSWFGVSNFYSTTAVGVNNVTLDYASESGTMHIRRVRVEIWRIN